MCVGIPAQVVEILAAEKKSAIVDVEGVRREVVENVSYIHFMFDQHEIVLADGEWSESYQPNDMRVGAMDERHRKELVAIFPELEEDTQAKYPAARPSIDAEQIARALQSEV